MHYQWIARTKSCEIDTTPKPMNDVGDKLVTNGGSEAATSSKSATCKNEQSVGRAKNARTHGARKPGPIATVKFGSASVPVYRSESEGRIRFMLCSDRDGKRIRKIFNSLDEAKKKAFFVAQRIQSGMQHVTDMKPHERTTM